MVAGLLTVTETRERSHGNVSAILVSSKNEKYEHVNAEQSLPYANQCIPQKIILWIGELI